jgi:3,4-dihydroxy 2-butanone 4-phosphate synthase/GTP cyclohydrolase II
MPRHFDSLERAIDAIRLGGLVILFDREDREHEGDLVGAGALATAETINTLVTHGRGAYVVAYLPHGRAADLGIPPMATWGSTGDTSSARRPRCMTAVDGAECGSGSSAADRAYTVRALSGPGASPDDLVMPGHIVPIEADRLGLTGRVGHTEAAVELVRRAGFDPPVSVGIEVLAADGSMADLDTLEALSLELGVPIIAIDQLRVGLT